MKSVNYSAMKANRLVWLLLLLMLGVAAAQQTNSFTGVNNGMTFKEVVAKAEKGDPLSQCMVGETYYFGYNGVPAVPVNKNEAVKWLRRAAEQGIAEAEFNLAGCYHDGQGVATNDVEAAKWWRKAAEQNFKEAQINLGKAYEIGIGVPTDLHEAAKWYKKAAEQGDAQAQNCLGNMYFNGRGVETNHAQAVKWYRMAAEQGNANAQLYLAGFFIRGDGVPKDYAEAFKWAYKAADQGVVDAQYLVGGSYLVGFGIPIDNIEAYKWFNLAAARGDQPAKTQLELLERQMTMDQIVEAQKLSREYKPGQQPEIESSSSKQSQQEPQLKWCATGFFITDDGYLISNYHVVKDATKVRLLTSAGLIDTKVVQVDAANDLALLKADGRFAPLPIAASRTVNLGGTVATIGFPDIGLQGFAPKLAKGEIASLSGAADDPRYFQISVPVQPGNSGGALVDDRGNVIGIVSAKLDASAALAASGALPENVNYAVKSSLLLSFLESVPAVSAKLKPPVTADRKFSDVVKSAQDAAVLVLVY
jgi:TPR repeat protein